VKAEHVLVACLVVVVIAFGSSAFAIVCFYFRLKRHEGETWRQLGSPMITLDRLKAMDDFVATRRFLKSGGHRALHDKTSASLGNLVLFTDRVLLGVAFLAGGIAGYIVMFVEP